MILRKQVAEADATFDYVKKMFLAYYFSCKIKLDKQLNKEI